LSIPFVKLNAINVKSLAKDIRNPIMSSITIEIIDFAHILTEQWAVRRFVVANRGRGAQEPQWSQ
jgi:hypothetical protein